MTTSIQFMGVGMPAALAKLIGDITGTTSGLTGTFTLNGTTQVVVPNINLAVGDLIVCSLKTVGGTVGAHPSVKTRTNGTGFNVAGTASDTSIFDYRILKA